MKQFLVMTLLLAAGALTQGAMAQPGGGGPEPGPGNGGGGATDVPIDGGVSLLLAGGAAYGVRRLRQRASRLR
ncbi:hypothetical protein Q5H93_11165 [Hymenobacter sp. ASUV-10]|uniref:VPEID-CTERM sorting domain-containing protein n=1 Tax=Hymenobacter aranciens TaxID=3063996 RepID=A0ABT9BAJ6_9BACT|nr:hypothetical protein [Hymenobacter sp. ASUV-10]MDO7875294.1 hypothetical protein [Hymenobacter sp. ASUV-10]